MATVPDLTPDLVGIPHRNLNQYRRNNGNSASRSVKKDDHEAWRVVACGVYTKGIASQSQFFRVAQRISDHLKERTHDLYCNRNRYPRENLLISEPVIGGLINNAANRDAIFDHLDAALQKPPMKTVFYLTMSANVFNCCILFFDHLSTNSGLVFVPETSVNGVSKPTGTTAANAVVDPTYPIFGIYRNAQSHYEYLKYELWMENPHSRTPKHLPRVNWKFRNRVRDLILRGELTPRGYNDSVLAVNAAIVIQ